VVGVAIVVRLFKIGDKNIVQQGESKLGKEMSKPVRMEG